MGNLTRVRTYALWLTGSAVLVVFAAFACVVLALGTQSESGRWVAECLQKKSDAVLSRSPRLVILAGSNALYGFSARRLSETHGIETVNAAVHAGLGLSYILHTGEQFFAVNRTLVLPLEYELYGKIGSQSAYTQHVIGFDPEYFKAMNVPEQIAFGMGISMVDRTSLLRQVIWPKPRNEVDGYQSRSLNAWGDETKHSVADRPAVISHKLRAVAPKKFTLDEAPWGELERFVVKARAAGSRVVLAHPSIFAGALDMGANKRFFADIEARAAALNVRFLDNAGDNAFGDTAVFDTMYHSTDEGQIQSTDRLARALKTRNLF